MRSLTQTENVIGQLLQTKRMNEQTSALLIDELRGLARFGFGSVTYGYLMGLARVSYQGKRASRKATQKQVRFANRLEHWIKAHGFRVTRNTTRRTERHTPIIVFGDGRREIDIHAPKIEKLTKSRTMTRWIELVPPSGSISYEGIAHGRMILPYEDSLRSWIDAQPTAKEVRVLHNGKFEHDSTRVSVSA